MIWFRSYVIWFRSYVIWFRSYMIWFRSYVIWFNCSCGIPSFYYNTSWNMEPFNCSRSLFSRGRFQWSSSDQKKVSFGLKLNHFGPNFRFELKKAFFLVVYLWYIYQFYYCFIFVMTCYYLFTINNIIMVASSTAYASFFTFLCYERYIDLLHTVQKTRYV